jgi:hypothetical protein
MRASRLSSIRVGLGSFDFPSVRWQPFERNRNPRKKLADGSIEQGQFRLPPENRQHHGTGIQRPHDATVRLLRGRSVPDEERACPDPCRKARRPFFDTRVDVLELITDEPVVEWTGVRQTHRLPKFLRTSPVLHGGVGAWVEDPRNEGDRNEKPLNLVHRLPHECSSSLSVFWRGLLQLVYRLEQLSVRGFCESSLFRSLEKECLFRERADRHLSRQEMHRGITWA